MLNFRFAERSDMLVLVPRTKKPVRSTRLPSDSTSCLECTWSTSISRCHFAETIAELKSHLCVQTYRQPLSESLGELIYLLTCWTLSFISRFRLDADEPNSWITQIHGGQKSKPQSLSISLPNIDRFSNFFHWCILWKICSKVVTKHTTTSKLRRYTTLWNIKREKSISIW